MSRFINNDVLMINFIFYLLSDCLIKLISYDQVIGRMMVDNHSIVSYVDYLWSDYRHFSVMIMILEDRPADWSKS